MRMGGLQDAWIFKIINEFLKLFTCIHQDGVWISQIMISGLLHRKTFIQECLNQVGPWNVKTEIPDEFLAVP
jgi:hypothetical protein